MPAMACTEEPANSSNALEMRLAQGTGRQQPTIAEAPIAVDNDDFAIARQGVMLQSIVAHDDVAPRVHQQLRRGGAIAADRHRRARAARQQNRLVAHHVGIVEGIDEPHVSRGTSMTAGDHARLEPDISQASDQPAHQRRLAGSSHAQVPDHDHRQWHSNRLAQPLGVQVASRSRRGAVDQRQRQQPPRRRRALVPDSIEPRLDRHSSSSLRVGQHSVQSRI